MEASTISPISFVLDHHQTLYFGNHNNPPSTSGGGYSWCWDSPKLGREEDIDLIMPHDATIHLSFHFRKIGTSLLAVAWSHTVPGASKPTGLWRRHNYLLERRSFKDKSHMYSLFVFLAQAASSAKSGVYLGGAISSHGVCVAFLHWPGQAGGYHIWGLW